MKFYPNHPPQPCKGNSSVGYEEGCVYVTLKDGHNATGSIMFSRQYLDKVSYVAFALITITGFQEQLS